MVITPDNCPNMVVDDVYENIIPKLSQTLKNIDEIKGIYVEGQRNKSVTYRVFERIHSYIEQSKNDYMVDLNDIITYLDHVNYVNIPAIKIIYKGLTGKDLPPIVLESHLMTKFVSDGFRALDYEEKDFFKKNYHSGGFFLRKPSFSGSSVVDIDDMRMYHQLEKFKTDFDDLIDYLERKNDIIPLDEDYFMSRKAFRAEKWVNDNLNVSITPMISDGRKIITDPQFSDEQREAVTTMLTSDERINCLTGPAGCISGDAELKISRNKKSYKITLRDLYHKFNDIPWDGKYYRSWGNDSDTYIRSNKDGVIGLNKVKNVMYSGVKETMTIYTHNRDITCTHDHKILTNIGWVRADELTHNHCLAVDTLYRHKKTSTLSKKHKNSVKQRNRDIEIKCGPHYPNCRTKGGISTYTKEQYIIYDAHVHGVTVEEFIRLTHNKGCVSYIDTTTHVIHHKDGVYTNNDIDNLEYISKESHYKLHTNGYSNFSHGLVEYENIVKIDDHCTCIEVYDIECEAPHHNFVANGVVVHNCGKTFVISSIVDNAHANGKNIVCCAFTGKAASRMEQSEVDVSKLIFPPKTIHSLMATIKYGSFTDIDLVIIDEASTMNSELFSDFISVLEGSSTLDKIKFLFVGDSNQLPPIGGGQIFEDIITLNKFPTHRLTKIFRTTDPAMLDFYDDVLKSKHRVSMNKHKKFFKTYNSEDVGSFIMTVTDLLFNKDKYWYKDNKCCILTHTNKYVDYINYLCYKNITGKVIDFYEYTFDDHPDDMELTWQPLPWLWKGAKIIFTKNDKIDNKANDEDVRVTNGTVADVVEVLGDFVLVRSYDDGRTFHIPRDYPTVKLAYAMTVYKSQGSEAQFIIYIHSNHIFETKRLAYTAMTRARKNLKIYTPTDGFKMSKDVPRLTHINSK